MYSCTQIINNHNTNNISNKKCLAIPIKESKTPTAEYSLTHNFFDPSKSSPPNDFMIKLQMRMSRLNKSNYKVINDDRRDSE